MVSAELVNFDQQFNTTLVGNPITTVVTVSPTVPASFTVDPSEVASGTSSTATITLSGPATANQEPWGLDPFQPVAITSGDPSVNINPVAYTDQNTPFVITSNYGSPSPSAVLYIPVGLSTAAVTLATSQVPAKTNVNLTAQLTVLNSDYSFDTYGSTLNAILTVDSPTYELTLSPSNVKSGQGVTATLTLPAPAVDTTQPWGDAGGEFFYLTSSDPAAQFVATPPSTPDSASIYLDYSSNHPGDRAYLIVPAGLTSVTFHMDTFLVTQLAASLVTAQPFNFDDNYYVIPSGQSVSALLFVNPIAIASFTVSPAEVKNGVGGTATITLDAPATSEWEPYGLDPFTTVHITSTDPSVMITPTPFTDVNTPWVATPIGQPDTDAVLLIPAGQT